jgi:hypothetical protein
MSKIFDDYQVDCNECKKYWDSSCDGVPISKKRNCTAYEATRTVDIPKRIDDLWECIKLTWITMLGLAVGFALVVINL